MNKIALAAGAVLLATAGAVLAQQGQGTPAAPAADMTRAQVIARVDQRFARLDLNRDGRFTPEEARQLRGQHQEQAADRMFARLDLNRDGNITRDEVNQARAQRAERNAERRAARSAEGATARTGERPRRFKRHGSGRGHGMRGGARLFGEQGFITAEQMRERALARFDRIDADRDGTVTAAERRQGREQMRERFRQRIEERRGREG